MWMGASTLGGRCEPTARCNTSNLRLNSVYTYIHLAIYIYIYTSLPIYASLSYPIGTRGWGASTFGGRCERIARCNTSIYGSTLYIRIYIYPYIYIYTSLSIYASLSYPIGACGRGQVLWAGAASELLAAAS